MNIVIFLTQVVSSLLLSCQKMPDPVEPPVVPPVDPPAKTLNILWQKPLTLDTINGIYGSAQYVTAEGDVLYTTDFTLPSAKAVLLSGKDGSKKWEYQVNSESLSLQNVFAINNHTLIHHWSYSEIINNANGQRIINNKIEDPGGGMPRANVIGDNFYVIHYSGDLPYSPSMSVVRSHYAQLKWDTLVTFNYANDGFYNALEPPALWINPQGDSVLIIRDGGIRKTPAFNNGKNRASLYAFNLRTRQFDWVQKDVNPGGQFANFQPHIDGNRMYINGVKTLQCIDLLTGATLWSRDFDKGLSFSSIVGNKDLMMVASSDIGMWGVDKQSGNIVWYNADVDGSTEQMHYFDGVVYCTSTGYARLYAVNAETGATIWKENSPNRNSRHPNASFAFAGIAIDTVNRKLYTADKYYLMCIALPEK